MRLLALLLAFFALASAATPADPPVEQPPADPKAPKVVLVAGSNYYKALALNYPNDEDRAEFDRLRRAGRIPRGTSLGGLIEIHGEGGRGRDWTKGCVALANQDMDDLFRRIGVGTPVTIVGGDGQGVFARMVREHGAAAGARMQ